MQSILTLFFLFSTNQNILNWQQNNIKLRYFDYIDIVHREEWDADESYRFTDHPKYAEQAAKKKYTVQTPRLKREERLYDQRTTYLAEKRPDEYDIHRKFNFIGSQELYRPNQYFYTKSKIIIHHSAMPSNGLTTPTALQKHVQEIQELHTFYRDWGDIGYHFLIDKKGNIYEGKGGGPGVIGAHAQFNNFNSIGINLLGNFQTEYPSQDQIKALIKLIVSLADYYHIDPNAQVLYHAKSDEEPYIQDFYDTPISYHKMVGQTACPGVHVIQKMPFIREFVTQYLQNFNKRQNHDRIIDELFSDINIHIAENKVSSYLQEHFDTYVHKPTIGTPAIALGISDPHREVKEIIIAQRNAQMLLPKNTQIAEEILKRYNKILNSIGQNNSITPDQRNLFMHHINNFIYFEAQFLDNMSPKNEEIFRLKYRELRNTITAINQ